MPRWNKLTANRDSLYGRRWKSYCKRYLRLRPLCVLCDQLGYTTQATVVDHIVPHCGDIRLFWDESNHQPLCQHCHDGAKQQQEKSGTLRGCTPSGIPVDSKHPWNQRTSDLFRSLVGRAVKISTAIELDIARVQF